jgi:hypothetical protein
MNKPRLRKQKNGNWAATILAAKGWHVTLYDQPSAMEAYLNLMTLPSAKLVAESAVRA